MKMAAIELPGRRSAGPPWGVIAMVLAGVVALAAIGVLGYTALSASPGTTQVNLPGVAAAADTITVDATGQLAVTPDLMTVSLGVEVTRGSVRDALTTANAEANKLIDTLKAQGVDAKDIRTSDVSINPQYNYNVSPRAVTGYQASNIVSATLRDLSKSGGIIATAAESVGNDIVIRNVSLSHNSKPDEVKQARQLAVQDAQSKAGQYGSLTGRKVGKVLAISDDYVTFTAMPYQGGGIGGGGVPVEAGQGAVIARVKVTYALES
jgi:uncharacterized protein